MFHLAGIGPLLFSVANAAAFVSDVHFEPGRALELIEDTEVTVLYPAYPPITQALFDQAGFSAARLPSARAMLNVAPPETLRQMQAVLPQATQVSLYGLTEGGGAVSFGSLDDDAETRLTTCGRPLPGVQVRIRNIETGAVSGPGKEGEILFRSYSVCDGYHADPDKTAAALTDDGYFCTGDLGVLDAGGHLTFLGRLKEMLKVGGENVAPAEIEAQLSLHPAVKLVQVVGVPDDRLGDVPAAFVELRTGGHATEAELLEHCRARIARFKLPRYVRFVTSWPMSATKIRRKELQAELMRELNRAHP